MNAPAVEAATGKHVDLRHGSRRGWPGWATAVVIFGVLALYPLVFTENVDHDLGTRALYFAIAATGWNLLGGYTGQISFGHALYFGAGAYGTVLLVEAGYSPWIAIPASLPPAILLALVTGFPVFALRRHYFSIATIAVAEIGVLIALDSEWLNKAAGISLPAKDWGLANLQFSPMDKRPYYYIALALFGLAVLAVWLFLRGKAGSYVKAIRDDQDAASAIGVPVRRYKLYSAMLSAAITALAGAFMVMYIQFVEPHSGFGIDLSVQFTLMVVLGGVGRFWGPLLGAWVLIFVQDATRSAFSGSGKSIDLLIYGALVVVVAVAEPGGLLAVAERIRNAVTRRFRKEASS